MTTAMETEVDLRRKYAEEERDAMFDAYIKACEAGDGEEATRVIAHMPIHPRWAKIVAAEILQTPPHVTVQREDLAAGLAELLVRATARGNA